MKDRVRGFSFESPIHLAVDEHKVLRAPTRNSESYTFDVAESQFSLFTAIVPWQQYVDLHVCEIQDSEDIVLVRAKAGFPRLEKGNHLPCHNPCSNPNQISDSLRFPGSASFGRVMNRKG